MTPTDPQPTPEQMAKAHAYSGIAADINETFTLAEFLKAQEQSYLAGLTKGRELASAGVEGIDAGSLRHQLQRKSLDELAAKDKRIEELEKRLEKFRSQTKESIPIMEHGISVIDELRAQLATATQNLAKDVKERVRLREAIEFLGNHHARCECSCMDYRGIASEALALFPTREAQQGNGGTDG